MLALYDISKLNNQINKYNYSVINNIILLSLLLIFKKIEIQILTVT
jgi:hypothetical protein